MGLFSRRQKILMKRQENNMCFQSPLKRPNRCVAHDFKVDTFKYLNLFLGWFPPWLAYIHILGHIPLQNRADDKTHHSACHKNPGDRECRINFQNIQVCRLQKVIAYQETYNAKKKHISKAYLSINAEQLAK